MRRSFRDAIIGISLLGGAVIFSGLTLWLRGVIISSNYWMLTASFKDASGISEGSPVTYRGIQIGSVKSISFTPKDVQAKIRVNQANLRLFKPVFAKVTTSSVLGGDVEIALVSQGNYNEKIDFLPSDKECNNKYILCEGDIIPGKDLKNISSLTEELSDILSQAGGEDIVSKISNSIDQFDTTQKNLDDLILLSKSEIERAQPIITDLKQAVANVRNIVSSIDDETTINDLKAAISSIKSITNDIEVLSDSVNDWFKDEELRESLKDALIGIGNLFKDIYK